MSAEAELTATLQVLRQEHQRLTAENAQLRLALAEYPLMLIRLATLLERLAALVPALEASVEAPQARRPAPLVGLGGGDYPEEPERWYGEHQGYPPPPAPGHYVPGPANAPPEAAHPDWVPGEGIVPQGRDEGETGLSLPQEPEDWEGR